MSAPLRLRVLGTGAMACWLGGLLARDRATHVTLCGTWAAALARLSGEGVCWSSPHEIFTARVEALPIDGPLPPADLVVVLVKAHQTARVARQAWRALAPGAALLSLQNGLGAREELLAAPGAGARLALGVATVGARLLAPGNVSVTGPGRVLVERLPGAGGPLEELVQRLRAWGVEATAEDDVRRTSGAS